MRHYWVLQCYKFKRKILENDFKVHTIKKQEFNFASFNEKSLTQNRSLTQNSLGLTEKGPNFANYKNFDQNVTF